MNKYPYQGPYYAKPDFPPPRLPGKAEAGTWQRVRNGTWYAFYANVGPGRVWNVEHPTDPQWWRWSKEDLWACRHGEFVGNCPDGSCGLAPDPSPPVTDDDVYVAARATLKLLRRMTDPVDAGDDMAESPAYWSIPTRIVHAVMQEAHDARSSGLCGLSLPAQIIEALVEAGFMEKPPQPEHNHFTPEPEPDTCPACEATVTEQSLAAYLNHCRSALTEQERPA